MSSNNFYNLLKEVTEEEIRDFFKKEFLDPLIIVLDGSERPAEEIRQARQQTNKIVNTLITIKTKK